MHTNSIQSQSDHTIVFFFHVIKLIFYNTSRLNKNTIMKKFMTAAALASSVSATTYLSENFDDAEWSDRWVTTEGWKTNELGKFKHTTGKFYHDAKDHGIQTSEDARFYGISSKMDSVFDNKDKDLVLQFSVKHENKLDCGGAYVKLLPEGLDQKNFGGDSDYAIMFGPDICGSTKRTHVIFTYKGENLLKDKEIRCETDQKIHVYTLIVKPDNTYIVQIDGDEKASGSLVDDWKFLAPKQIKDPSKSKPDDWVDEKQIPDPDSVKPDGYDDIPEMIADPDAEQPDDWDEEDDGEWEPPMLPNPEWKGPWKQAMMANPEYIGEWEHPMIDNPDFVDDPEVYRACRDGCSYVGFELWQVKSGTIFDDILVTDDVSIAKNALKTFKLKRDGQNKMEQEEKRKEEEAKKAAEEDDDEEDEADEHEEL